MECSYRTSNSVERLPPMYRALKTRRQWLSKEAVGFTRAGEAWVPATMSRPYCFQRGQTLGVKVLRTGSGDPLESLSATFTAILNSKMAPYGIISPRDIETPQNAFPFRKRIGELAMQSRFWESAALARARLNDFPSFATLLLPRGGECFSLVCAASELRLPLSFWATGKPHTRQL